MALKHIVVHLDSTKHSEKRAKIAIDLAKRFSAHLTGVYGQADTDEPSDLIPQSPNSSVQVSRAAKDATDRFEAQAKEAGLPVDSRIIPAVSYSQLIKHLTYAVRDSDMAVMGQHDPKATKGELPEDLVEQVSIHSGRPILVIPYAGEFPHIGRRVIVGWNGTREAARALNDAIPLMQGAEAVQLLSINPPREILEHYNEFNESVRTHLKLHGIEAEVMPHPNPDVAVADLLVSRASDFAADLMVKGAHGQYGFPHIFRGGTTRDLLRQLTVPVLLSH